MIQGFHWDLRNQSRVVMNEVQARARKDNAPANFAILRRIALN